MVETRTRIVRVAELEIAVSEMGDPARPALVLLHGWPQSSRVFARVMRDLADEFHAIALDLPGVGGSRGKPKSGRKKLLAEHVREVVNACSARHVVLVGHDVGGMIAFAYVRSYASELRGAVILDTVIPGLEPAWSNVLSNPRVWHFAFHAIPKLPDLLVRGQERPYFDFFFDAISREKKAISNEARDAYARDYSRPEALEAGFDWYRAMPADAEENARYIEVRTPALYLRGDSEPATLSDYLEGLRKSGFANLEGDVVPRSGHFSVDEAPDALVQRLRRFARDC